MVPQSTALALALELDDADALALLLLALFAEPAQADRRRAADAIALTATYFFWILTGIPSFGTAGLAALTSCQSIHVYPSVCCLSHLSPRTSRRLADSVKSNS